MGIHPQSNYLPGNTILTKSVKVVEGLEKLMLSDRSVVC